MTRFSWRTAAACAVLALAGVPHLAHAEDPPQGLFIEPADGKGKRVQVGPSGGPQGDNSNGITVTGPPIDPKVYSFFGRRNAGLFEVTDVKTDAPKTEQDGRTSVEYHVTMKIVDLLRPLAQNETDVSVDIEKPSNAHSFLSQWLPIQTGARFVAAFDDASPRDAFDQDANSNSKELTPLAFDRTVTPNWRDMTTFRTAIDQTASPISVALAEPVRAGSAGHLYFQLVGGYSDKTFGSKTFISAFLHWLQDAKVSPTAKAEILTNYLSTPIDVTKAANPEINRAVAVAGAAAILSVSRSTDKNVKDQISPMLRAYCELFLMNDRPQGVTAATLAPGVRQQLVALAQRKADPESREYYAAWGHGGK